MWRKIFQVLGLIAALLSLLPLIAADYWWIRIFDFPHLQLTAFTLIAILLYFFTFKPKWVNDYAYISILIGCFIFQFVKFIDYTPFVDVEVKDSSAHVNNDSTIAIYTANVLQKNKNGDNLFQEIKEKQPDLIVFTETNQRWSTAINKQIGKDYPYKVEQPQDNTYGMLVYSKMALKDTKIKFKVDPNIPSIEAKVMMRNGHLFQLYAIHPTPPMPQHNPMSTDRDKELILTAMASYKSDLPVIVLGDFNDVAWSASTQLTKTIGKLLDLRIGRGFYNTYHAQYPLMRWSLDHILISPEFRLKDAGTGVNFDSDHFPSWAVLTFEPDLASQQQPNEPSEDDWKKVKKQMKKSGIESLVDLPNMIDNAGDELAD
ncbi:endonuclease [Nonlabens arenilitoris]|uniref:Endonuclease n=1 Tax=Nonlabens arenilitoris TaxID=1217969 RepID=A0A2S7UCW6_9FLAO|nr:endonuclease/exonuclease/phosphatase family protein [Nonlabens arenilitoris]PQJ32729.1 endonuclease [Nonlabens arenilitoris]